jgi:hypothetical protein
VGSRFREVGGPLREGAPSSGGVVGEGGRLHLGGAVSPLRGCIRGRREVKVEGGMMSSNGAKASKSKQKQAKASKSKQKQAKASKWHHRMHRPCRNQ